MINIFIEYGEKEEIEKKPDVALKLSSLREVEPKRFVKEYELSFKMFVSTSSYIVESLYYRYINIIDIQYNKKIKKINKTTKHTPGTDG